MAVVQAIVLWFRTDVLHGRIIRHVVRFSRRIQLRYVEGQTIQFYTELTSL